MSVWISPERNALINELLPRIEEPFRATCEAIMRGQARSFAQAWQDWWLHHNLFGRRMTWGSGVYIEVGVWDPLHASNTLFFDKCLGWQGVCFEPNPKWHSRIRQNRSCTLVPHCVSSSNVSVNFVRPGASGGTAHVARKHSGAHAGAPVAASISGALRMRCVVLGEALAALGRPDTVVDLLSVDVEGSEADVLRCFPWARHRPRAVLLETNQAGDLREVDRFFHRKGYVNRETFVNGELRPGGKLRPQWVDNLYVPHGGPTTVYPPAKSMSDLSCDSADEKRFRAQWCQPWMGWQPKAHQGFGDCTELSTEFVERRACGGRPTIDC